MINQTSPQPSAVQLANRELRSMRFWVFFICCFFAIDFTVAAIAISMAAGDPSFRSIPGYGERAVAWDVRQARKQTSKELGWKVQIERSMPSLNEMVITISDAADKPVVDCTGSVRMFHFTRVAEQFEGKLIATAPGVYKVPIDVSKPGLWQLELEIHASGDRQFWDERTLNWFEHTGQESSNSR
jgi:FixH